MYTWILRVFAIIFLLLSYLPIAKSSENHLDLYGSADDPYATKAQQMVRKLAKEERTNRALAHTITIDTRDQESCHKLQASLPNEERFVSMCVIDPQNPMITVVQFQELNESEYRRVLNTKKIFSNENKIENHTRNTAFMMTLMMGFLIALPTEITKWDRTDENPNIFENYVDNIRKGPVVDEDNWFFNYVTHPWAGALYYGIARHSGFSRWQSFGYSAFMSTVLWEYGFEAVKEVPSIQDIFITPIIGSLFGELFYQLEMEIIENNGRILGSKSLGSLGQFVLNPGYHVSVGINQFLGKRFIQDAETNLVTAKRPISRTMPELGDASYIGLQMNFRFW